MPPKRTSEENMSDRPATVLAQSIDHAPLLFGANQPSYYAYKKTERLCVALHLVTNFVPNDEPVRYRIRDKALALLSDILVLRHGFRNVGAEHVSDVVASLVELTTFLEVANASGFLSRMNLAVLQQECLKLSEFLRSQEDTAGAESLALTERYFTVSTPPAAFSAGGRVASAVSKGQETVKDKKKSISRVRAPSRAAAAKRSRRRETILALLRQRGRVSVKDVAPAVRDCSEKTLQRELVGMVRDGLLKRHGERRWSIYTLV